jgi:hypothetical protein
LNIEEILNQKGINPIIVTESGSHFVARFLAEDVKNKAVKILIKLGFAITAETAESDHFKIVGLKKKPFPSQKLKNTIAQIVTYEDVEDE